MGPDQTSPFQTEAISRRLRSSNSGLVGAGSTRASAHVNSMRRPEICTLRRRVRARWKISIVSWLPGFGTRNSKARARSWSSIAVNREIFSITRQSNADRGHAGVEYAYRAVQRYGQRVREAGALFVQTTIPKRVNASSPNVNFRRQIEAVNELLRSRWREDDLCDALIDVALEPRFGNPDDRMYYVDGTHLTVLGYTVLAERIVPILEAIAGGQLLRLK
jgi:hypothetical protein